MASDAPLPARSSALPPALVRFDGECALCSRSVRFVLSRDRARRLRFAPLERAPAAGDAAPTTLLVVVGERTLDRSDAILAIAARLPFPWPVIAAACALVPKRARDALYGLVARNRHRFGRVDACPFVPEPQPPGPAARSTAVPAPSVSSLIQPSETNQSPS